MGYLSENLKLLIWQSREGPSKSWSDHIESTAASCGIPAGRFRSLMEGKGTASGPELAAIRKHFSRCGKDTGSINDRPLCTDLAARYGDMLLNENLYYLLGTLEYGEAERFIGEIGVVRSTLTRWKSEASRPDRYARNQIARYFGFGNEEELKTRFLFLEQEPVTTEQKKKICRKRIDEMDRKTFDSVYPKLLELLTKDV